MGRHPVAVVNKFSTRGISCWSWWQFCCYVLRWQLFIKLKSTASSRGAAVLIHMDLTFRQAYWIHKSSVLFPIISQLNLRHSLLSHFLFLLSTQHLYIVKNIYIYIYIYMVGFTLLQTTKTHRGSRGVTLLCFWISALEGGEESASRPGRFLSPGKTRYPMYRRLGGPQDRSGQMRKISPPPGFDPRTVQHVGSRYTDWATRPTYTYIHIWLCADCICIIVATK
jgi:hypothetical protein